MKPATPKNRWGYWLRLLAFFAVALTVALVATPTLLGALFMVGLLYAPCTESNLTPANLGYPAEAVTVPARSGGSFKGYFVPGSNGATIIMPPPMASGRGVRLPYADMLARHGFAIFMFESRRCAGMGPLSLGYKEVDDVADALTYLSGRTDVDPQRIGIYGFSSAGATSIMAAARLPQLRAVVAEGGYGHFAQNAFGTHSGDYLSAYFLTFFRWGAFVTYRGLTGLNIDRLSPVSVIGDISPRPILLIYGSREVSLSGGRQQQMAAGQNAELWVVEGAGHGNYLTVAPNAYQERVVTFFNRALLEKFGN